MSESLRMILHRLRDTALDAALVIPLIYLLSLLGPIFLPGKVDFFLSITYLLPVFGLFYLVISLVHSLADPTVRPYALGRWKWILLGGLNILFVGILVGQYITSDRQVDAAQLLTVDQIGTLRSDVASPVVDSTNMPVISAKVKKLAEELKGNVYTSFDKGVVDIGLGNYEGALEHLLTAASFTEEGSALYTSIYDYLGMVKLYTGDADEAIEHFNTATQGETDDPKACFGRAIAYTMQGDHAAANENIRKTIELLREDTTARTDYYRAFVYVLGAEYQRAEEVLGPAVDLGQVSCQLLVLRAQVLAKLDDLEEARNMIDAAHRQCPGDPDVKNAEEELTKQQ